MDGKQISRVPRGSRYLLALLIIAGSFIIPASRLAYAHTFSDSESARFLSLVDKLRAETALVTMNLENNNATLAQSHAAKASNLLDNSTIREIRERNSRIAVTLDDGLKNLQKNVTSIASGSQGGIPQNEIQSINQAVMSLNDTLGEAITSRVEREQLDNVTTWAMALADLTNTVLNNYGNATGSAANLTNTSNMTGMSSNSSGINTNSPMTANSTSSMSHMTTTIVNTAAYQSAQYLANKSILKMFNDNLKPLTLTSNNTMVNNANASTSPETAGNLTASNNNNIISSLNNLQTSLLQLRDEINNRASTNEVMTTAHSGIHPLLMKTYGLTLAQEG